MARHVLITNDFPPKVGGIQNYLYELWRRLPSDDFVVLTSSSHPDAPKFDAEQSFPIVRGPRVLLPTKAMVKRARDVINEYGAEFAVIDPALPLGRIGTKLGVPYSVVLHGAEVTVPARLPLSRSLLAPVLRNAKSVISAGEYAGNEARRLVGDQLPPVRVIPPGIDVSRFEVADRDAVRDATRSKYSVAPNATVITGHSRLVPRKGFDTLIRAAAKLGSKDITVVIVGRGRDQRRLERLSARLGVDARFLGRVGDSELTDLLISSDVFAMLRRNRWLGLEQEGFGIVFLEAAAAGLAQVAGDSGGAAEAVIDGETGLIVRDPSSASAVAKALASLIDDDALRAKLGANAAARVRESFTYDGLAERLAAALR